MRSSVQKLTEQKGCAQIGAEINGSGEPSVVSAQRCHTVSHRKDDHYSQTTVKHDENLIELSLNQLRHLLNLLNLSKIPCPFFSSCNSVIRSRLQRPVSFFQIQRFYVQIFSADDQPLFPQIGQYGLLVERFYRSDLRYADPFLFSISMQWFSILLPPSQLIEVYAGSMDFLINICVPAGLCSNRYTYRIIFRVFTE